MTEKEGARPPYMRAIHLNFPIAQDLFDLLGRADGGGRAPEVCGAISHITTWVRTRVGYAVLCL